MEQHITLRMFAGYGCIRIRLGEVQFGRIPSIIASDLSVIINKSDHVAA